MRKGALFILLLVSTAAGQVSVEEAHRRLAERKAQRKDDPAPTATRPVASTAPATSRPTKPPAQLLAEAYDLMQAGKIDKAAPLFEQIRRQTPPPQRSRAMVLDAAIVDYTQNVNVQRAVKELSAYVATAPLDEMATDLLGAADRKANDRAPRYLTTPVSRDAQRVLADSVSQLQAKRPEMHKWGKQWVTDSVFASIQEAREAAQRDYEQAMKTVTDAKQQIAACEQRLNAARNIDTAGPPPPAGASNDLSRQVAAQKRFERERDARLAQEEMSRAQERLKTAQADADAALARVPKPDWPTVFEPVPPEGAAVTMPATTQAAK
jgi:hypothetical protein